MKLKCDEKLIVALIERVKVQSTCCTRQQKEKKKKHIKQDKYIHTRTRTHHAQLHTLVFTYTFKILFDLHEYRVWSGVCSSFLYTIISLVL